MAFLDPHGVGHFKIVLLGERGIPIALAEALRASGRVEKSHRDIGVGLPGEPTMDHALCVFAFPPPPRDMRAHVFAHGISGDDVSRLGPKTLAAALANADHVALVVRDASHVDRFLDRLDDHYDAQREETGEDAPRPPFEIIRLPECKVLPELDAKIPVRRVSLPGASSWLEDTVGGLARARAR